MTNSRLLNACIIGLLASATAVAYSWALAIEHHRSGLLGVGALAFIGGSCAGYTVAKGSPRNVLDAARLILLGDLFAFLFLMFGVLMPSITHGMDSAHPELWSPPSSKTIWQRLPNIALFYIFAFTMGNILTKGVGFIMMLPPALLALARRRQPIGPVT